MKKQATEECIQHNLGSINFRDTQDTMIYLAWIQTYAMNYTEKQKSVKFKLGQWLRLQVK